MATLSLQEKLAQYYRSSGQDDMSRLQAESNAEVDSLHPVAKLNFNFSNAGGPKELEVVFYRAVDGLLSAKVYALATGLIKRHPISTIQEQNIVHSGRIWSKRVVDMGQDEKEAFIARLPSMTIRDISDIVYVW